MSVYSEREFHRVIPSVLSRVALLTTTVPVLWLLLIVQSFRSSPIPLIVWYAIWYALSILAGSSEISVITSPGSIAFTVAMLISAFLFDFPIFFCVIFIKDMSLFLLLF